MQLLEVQNLRDRMSQNCRAIALKEYPLELQAKAYIELYRQALQIKGDHICQKWNAIALKK